MLEDPASKVVAHHVWINSLGWHKMEDSLCQWAFSFLTSSYLESVSQHRCLTFSRG